MAKVLRPFGHGSLSIVVDSTRTLREFKAENNTETLRAIESTKKPGSFFMVNDLGKSLGAVSTGGGKFQPKDIEHPVVSEFYGTPTEENPTGFFFMLHKRGEGGTVNCEW